MLNNAAAAGDREMFAVQTVRTFNYQPYLTPSPPTPRLFRTGCK
jgi:hypothetical protein